MYALHIFELPITNEIPTCKEEEYGHSECLHFKDKLNAIKAYKVIVNTAFNLFPKSPNYNTELNSIIDTIKMNPFVPDKSGGYHCSSFTINENIGYAENPFNNRLVFDYHLVEIGFVDSSQACGVDSIAIGNSSFSSNDFFKVLRNNSIDVFDYKIKIAVMDFFNSINGTSILEEHLNKEGWRMLDHIVSEYKEEFASCIDNIVNANINNSNLCDDDEDMPF